MSLLGREVTRFYRQPSRVIGVFGLPLMFWAVMGLGFGGQFAIGGENTMTYFFPGSILMVVLFTSIFSTISVIEDRHSGFLQGVLVSPAPRSAIVLGKVFGGTLLGLIQGILLTLFLWVTAGFPAWDQVLASVASLMLISLVLTALGFVFAWRLDSVQGFHGVMNLVLMPMWILSGALFPLPGSGVLRLLMLLNPLHYGLELFRGAVNGALVWTAPTTPRCALVLIGFGLALLPLSLKVIQIRGRESAV
ncbi:MAG: ABC transporter permease [Deltaproteobacteria bacterium]|nr:ABC transporter permease [Deltaproteobacteria bacterium]